MAQTNNHRYATSAQRRRLLIIQDFKCALCSAELTQGDCECDHIIPFSAGGSTTIENLQAICKKCHKNKTKSDGSRLS